MSRSKWKNLGAEGEAPGGNPGRKEKPLNRRKKNMTRRRTKATRGDSQHKALPCDPAAHPSGSGKPASSQPSIRDSGTERQTVLLSLTASSELSNQHSVIDEPATDLGKILRAEAEALKLPPGERRVLDKIAQALEEKRPPGRPPGMTKDRLGQATMLQQLIDTDPIKRGALKRAAFKVYPSLRQDLAYERARQTLKDWRRVLLSKP